MQGRDLIISRIIFQQNGKEDQSLLTHKPLQLGTTKDCDIKIEGPGNCIFAEIFVVDQELIIRNIGNNEVIYINGIILIDRIILKIGDQIEIRPGRTTKKGLELERTDLEPLIRILTPAPGAPLLFEI